MTPLTESYILEISVPDFRGNATDEDRQALARLPRLLEAAEEDLADLLPDGWTVRIQPQGGKDE